MVTAWLSKPRQAGSGFACPVDAGRAMARALQELALGAAHARGAPRPFVTQVVVHDHPGRVLTARSEGAAMVVVGSGTQSPASRKVLGPGGSGSQLGEAMSLVAIHSPLHS